MVKNTLLATTLCLLLAIFVGCQQNEIAPPLREYYDIDGAVIMDVRNISDGIVDVYITNDSSMYILFGHADFSIEHFDSSYWRILPLKRNIVFTSEGLLIAPNTSQSRNISFANFDHQPRQGELYRVRLTATVATADDYRPPSPTTIIHDIVAEFNYD